MSTLLTIGSHLVKASQARKNGDVDGYRFHVRHIKQLCDAALEVSDCE